MLFRSGTGGNEWKGEGASCEDKDRFFDNRKSGESRGDFVKWMRERKWYLKTMAVGFIGSFFLLFLFYRQAALCFLGAVLGSVCYVRYRIKVQKEQEKWQLMVEFKEAMDSMVSALAAGYSMENAITEAYRDMKLLHSEDTRMMRELWDIQQKISLHQPLDEVLSAFASKRDRKSVV